MLVECSKCHKWLSVQPIHVGRTVPCPACGVLVTIPIELPENAQSPGQNPFDFEERSPRRRRREDDDDDYDHDPPTRRRRRGEEESSDQWLFGVAGLPVPILVIFGILIIGGWLIGTLCGVAAAAINTAVARQRHMSVALKLVVFLTTTVVAGIVQVILGVIVLAAIFGDKKNRDIVGLPDVKPLREEPRGPLRPEPGIGGPKERLPPKGWDTTVIDFPTSRVLAPVTEQPKPNEEIHHAVWQTRVRLANGPAAATAAYIHGDRLTVGFADGTTALWDLRRPAELPGQPGPKFPGPIDRLWLAGTDRYILAESGGKLWIATVESPHRAVVVPVGSQFAVRSCGFSTAAIVHQTPEGYQARWVVDAVFDKKTVMPPQKFGQPFFDVELTAPPVEPQFLVWLHSTPAAVLPDGRVTWWNGQGNARTIRAHEQPIQTWVNGDLVAFVSLDRAGFLHVRDDGEFAKVRQYRVNAPLPTRLMGVDAGNWVLGTDNAGGVTLWETQHGKELNVIYKGTAKSPVRPLAAAHGYFVVGLGPQVEIWSRGRLEKDMKGE